MPFKLENISDLDATPNIGKTTVSMKVSGFCFDMNFHYCLIIHGSHNLYNVLTWVTLFLLHFMLSMLKLDINYGFHELFLK